MLRFAMMAFLINATTVVMFMTWRHAVSRWRWPGVWWLSLVTVAIVLTLLAARSML